MPKGFVVVDRERCKGCGLCVSVCPFAVLELSKDYNRSGYAVVAMAQPEKCTGCTVCAQSCPDVAIEVYREKAVAREPVGGSKNRATGTRPEGARDA